MGTKEYKQQIERAYTLRAIAESAADQKLTVDGDVTWAVLAAGFSIFAMCRAHFQSCIILARHGYAGDVAICARALFESFLALRFVVRKDVELSAFKNGKQTVRHAGLSCHERACIYAGHNLVQRLKDLDGPIGDAAPTPEELAEVRHRYEADLRNIDAELPHAWKQRIRKAMNYHDGRIKDLAYSLGQKVIYDVLYGSQSRHVHAAHFTHHYDKTTIGDVPVISCLVESEPFQVAMELQQASLFMVLCINELYERFDYPDDPRLQQFVDETNAALKPQEPNP